MEGGEDMATACGMEYGQSLVQFSQQRASDRIPGVADRSCVRQVPTAPQEGRVRPRKAVAQQAETKNVV